MKKLALIISLSIFGTASPNLMSELQFAEELRLPGTPKILKELADEPSKFKSHVLKEFSQADWQLFVRQLNGANFGCKRAGCLLQRTAVPVGKSLMAKGIINNLAQHNVLHTVVRQDNRLGGLLEVLSNELESYGFCVHESRVMDNPCVEKVLSRHFARIPTVVIHDDGQLGFGVKMVAMAITAVAEAFDNDVDMKGTNQLLLGWLDEITDKLFFELVKVDMKQLNRLPEFGHKKAAYLTNKCREVLGKPSLLLE